MRPFVRRRRQGAVRGAGALPDSALVSMASKCKLAKGKTWYL